MKICSFPNCGRPYKAKGLCPAHYYQQKAGKELVPLTGRALSDLERFWANVEKTADCWVWAGRSKTSEGYGLTHWQKAQRLAHRVSYIIHVGPIPEGLDIDHKCHNKACVNPDHLQAVTHKQNLENRAGATSSSKTGVRGVSWDKRKSKYTAFVVDDGKAHWAGYYEDIEGAEAAVIAKRNELYTNNLADRRTA